MLYDDVCFPLYTWNRVKFLSTGKNGRGWNEVHLSDENGKGHTYIIDLMYDSGHLILNNSEEAQRYTTFPLEQRAGSPEHPRPWIQQVSEPSVNIACVYDRKEISKESGEQSDQLYEFSSHSAPNSRRTRKFDLTVVGRKMRIIGCDQEDDESTKPPMDYSFSALNLLVKPPIRYMDLSTFKTPYGKSFRTAIDLEIMTASEASAKKAAENGKTAEDAVAVQQNMRDKQAAPQPLDTANKNNAVAVDKKPKVESKKVPAKWTLTPKFDEEITSLRPIPFSQSKEYIFPQRKMRGDFQMRLKKPIADHKENSTEALVASGRNKKSSDSLLGNSSDSEEIDWVDYDEKEADQVDLARSLEKVQSEQDAQEADISDPGWEVLTAQERVQLERWEMDFDENSLDSEHTGYSDDEANGAV